ncbi:MAG: response regulator [Clostridia bacterium]|nr:response regulator [Clostridia bacterium]
MKAYILDTLNGGMGRVLSWLSEDTHFNEVCLMRNPEVFLSKISLEKPDVSFIRIGSSQFSGLQTGQIAKEIHPNGQVIFIADRKDYALDAYEVGAYGYLLSPIDKNKFDHFVNGLIESKKQDKNPI